MDYNKIAKLAEVFEKRASEGFGQKQLTQFTSEDVKQILFAAGLFPVFAMPKDANDHPKFNVNHPVLNEYVWPAVDRHIKSGEAIDLYIHVKPGGIVYFTSNNDKIASDPKIKELADKMTKILAGRSAKDELKSLFASGLQ